MPEATNIQLNENQSIKILFNEDNTEAKAQLCGSGESPITAEQILRALAQAKVKKGIQRQFIDRLAKHNVYGQPFKVAVGKKAIHGADSWATCAFGPMPATQFGDLHAPMDYSSIGLAFVKKGDLLGELFEAQKGSDGYDVFGNTISGSDGRSSAHALGPNVRCEDGRIYAQCDGAASLLGSQFCVDHVTVLEQVDKKAVFDCPGDLVVEGNVGAEARLTVGGSLWVKGRVENAIVVAGRNVISNKGITGRVCEITAQGTVYSPFVENAQINARKRLYANVLLNAQVICGEYCIVCGDKGRLVGGSCQVGIELRAVEIGNDSNTATAAEVGVDSFTAQEREELTAWVDKLTGEIEKLDRASRTYKQLTGTPEENLDAMIKAAMAIRVLKADLQVAMLQLSELTYADAFTKRLAAQRLYPGVNLIVEGVAAKNDELHTNCTVTASEGRLVFGTPLVLEAGR